MVEGVVTDLKEASGPLITSQRVSFSIQGRQKINKSWAFLIFGSEFIGQRDDYKENTGKVNFPFHEPSKKL